MITKSIKKCSTLFILLCFLAFPLSTYAIDSPDNLDLDATVLSLINIQKQLSSLAQSGYINKLSAQTNDQLVKSVSIYTDQLDTIRSMLLNYVPTNTPTKRQNSNLQTILASTAYLKYITGNLSDYLNSTDPIEQYDLLTDYIRANSLLTQLFAYLD